MSWHRPNIGSRVTREGHARFVERPEVKFLRATRQTDINTNASRNLVNFRYHGHDGHCGTWKPPDAASQKDPVPCARAQTATSARTIMSEPGTRRRQR